MAGPVEYLTKHIDTWDLKQEEGLPKDGRESTGKRAMMERTYEDKEYWNRIYTLVEPPKKEQVVLDGNDGENKFDDDVLKIVKDKEVLDIGCGDGSFTLEIAKRARRVVGVDFSEVALAKGASNHAIIEQKNMRLQLANAKGLPFADAEFDAVVSRRGPATATARTLSEAYRVLKRSGLLMEITVGERNCENLAKVFGRGQMLDVKERIAFTKKKMLEEAGFKGIQTTEYVATEIFPSMKRLIIRLNDSPIIPEFEAKKDERSLAAVEEQCRTARGIETPVHRIIIIAKK